MVQHTIVALHDAVVHEFTKRGDSDRHIDQQRDKDNFKLISKLSSGSTTSIYAYKYLGRGS